MSSRAVQVLTGVCRSSVENSCLFSLFNDFFFFFYREVCCFWNENDFFFSVKWSGKNVKLSSIILPLLYSCINKNCT